MSWSNYGASLRSAYGSLLVRKYNTFGQRAMHAKIIGNMQLQDIVRFSMYNIESLLVGCLALQAELKLYVGSLQVQF